MIARNAASFAADRILAGAASRPRWHTTCKQKDADRRRSDWPVSPHLAPNPSAHETGGTAITTRDWESSMDRRTVLKGLAGAGSLAATGGLSMPALSQGAAARTLRFVPQANLANFDPVWGTQYVVR